MSFHRLLSLWFFFFWCSHLQAKDRLTKLLRGACKCSESNCFQQFGLDETKNFLDAFEARSKLEQDTILFLAWSDAGQGHGPQLRTSKSTRREFFSWGSTWKEYVLKLCLVYLHTELTNWCDWSTLWAERFQTFKIGSVYWLLLSHLIQFCGWAAAQPVTCNRLDYSIFVLL